VARALPCGDYGVVADGGLVAAVERKSIGDLVSSVTNTKLRYALGDLAALPRAAVVVEDRYSALFKRRHALAPPPSPTPGRIPGPLADDPSPVLRDPAAGRGVDLSLPRRRLAMGRHPTGRPGADSDHRSPAPQWPAEWPEPTVAEVRAWAPAAAPH
jgi:ERCC4 domain-containing protein